MSPKHVRWWNEHCTQTDLWCSVYCVLACQFQGLKNQVSLPSPLTQRNGLEIKIVSYTLRIFSSTVETLKVYIFMLFFTVWAVTSGLEVDFKRKQKEQANKRKAEGLMKSCSFKSWGFKIILNPVIKSWEMATLKLVAKTQDRRCDADHNFAVSAEQEKSCSAPCQLIWFHSSVQMSQLVCEHVFPTKRLLISMEELDTVDVWN